ncbi:MAG: helix-turn-helix domain-containing protein [Bacilli bacterium]|nr:helix-turn-helix domain-containing protein [Bacilli bacterium]
MSVFKIEKTKDFTIMSNYHLRDRNLSFKAKGLLSFMLSLPPDWDYSLKGLCAISKENRDAIRSTLKELQDNHYLEIEKVRGNKGYFEYNYLIYEKPHIIDRDNESSPDMENPPLDNPNMEEQLQINTNKQNNKRQIDKDDKTIPSFFVAEEHNILTLELIDRGYITEEDTQIFYYDKLFENLLEEDNSYKDLIQIIHYIVPRVTKRNFIDEDGNVIENKFGYFKSSIISNINKLKNPIENLWEDEEEFFEEYVR